MGQTAYFNVASIDQEGEAKSEMNLWECFRVAVRGLSNNKLRTALTMLGIIIGVGVVILVVA
ncbi:MAG TPA: hypothetical protein VKU00_33175, partial [Chthonomonadaceae bacterium]|nr:hypothetical protein [Chthonomonadaceae bacterium]